MKHVSFDFDGTLEFSDVQAYAALLMKRDDVTVWITTRRLPDNGKHNNFKLHAVAKRLGIPKERITYCSLQLKYTVISDRPFIWHLDDDPEDLKTLAKASNIKCIQYMKGGRWMGFCEKFLKQ